MYKQQTTIIGNPIGVNANIGIGARPASTASPLTTKLVDVPISVTVPPTMAAIDKGIRTFDGEILRRFDHS